MARAVIPKFNTITVSVNLLRSFSFKNKQLAITSRGARTIAASPPKSRNVRNITGSEKLSEKFERGIVKLILGAIISVKITKRTKLQLKTFESKLKIAKVNDKPPSRMTANLKNVRTFTRFIKREPDRQLGSL
ncbi:MAG TPA: hypothetical protein VGB68_02890 [Pyrinomonadaceae bacterium]